MAALFPFEVHTPYRPFFSDSVEAITLKLSDGDIGVYANHAPFTAPVISCILRMKDKSGAWRSAFISNGILEVRRHKAVLIIDTAEWPEEIDRERAEASAKAAKDNLADAMMKYEADAAKEKMRRAELRLKVANTKINEK